MYKFHSKGKDTAHPQYGEIVRLKMIVRMGDSTLENTSTINEDGTRKNLQKPVFRGAIEEGICMMTLGDSATFLVSTDSINKYYPAKEPAKNFQPHDYLAFDVKLVNIQTVQDVQWEIDQKKKAMKEDRKEKEPKELSQYIQDNHIEAKPTSTGLYFIETTKGKGASSKEGDSLFVHYTGSLLNGSVFGSSMQMNRPVGFVLGEQRMLKGWNEAVKKMQKGSAASIILPSALAFDSIGDYDRKNNQYRIPPYSAVKFEIQLTDIKSKK